MIDRKDQVTPEALRQEANNLEYTGRQHHADIMRWAADIIEELGSLLERYIRHVGESEGIDFITWNSKPDQICGTLEYSELFSDEEKQELFRLSAKVWGRTDDAML